jgi:AraC family transcriptional regulator of arabinose operon
MPSEAPHPQFRLLTTGFFHEGPAYSTFRTRGTDDWLIILTTGGAGRFGYGGGQEFVAGIGDAILIKPGTRHEYRTDATAGKWDLLWAHVHPWTHWLEWLDWPTIDAGLMCLHLDASARDEFYLHLHEAHLLATGARRRNEELAMNALERALLTADAVNPRSSQPGVDERIRDAMDFACRNLGKKLSLDDLAETAGLSLSRFAHLFREQTGTTPQQFIEQQRIGQAKQLLELSSRSIKQIARDLGFDSPFYFSQRFRKQVGMSPRDYRDRT